VTLGPGAISHGRGEEKPKGTEQLELLQGDGVAGWSGYKVGSRRSSDAVLSKGGCHEQARVFSGGFPHLV
jgi:hypothetical protein